MASDWSWNICVGISATIVYKYPDINNLNLSENWNILRLKQRLSVLLPTCTGNFCDSYEMNTIVSNFDKWDWWWPQFDVIKGLMIKWKRGDVYVDNVIYNADCYDNDDDDNDDEGCFLKSNLNKSSQECKLVCLIKGELALVLASSLSGDDDDDDDC